MSRLKVLQLLTAVDYGGVERYVSFLVRHLPREQFEVAVAAAKTSRNRELLEEMGVPFYPVAHLGKAIHPWRDGQALAEIHRVIRSFRPDIVHTHMFKAGLLGRMAARLQGVPAILFTAHGFHFNTFRSPLMKGIAYAVEKAMARHCSHMILPVSQAETWQALSKKIIPANKLCTVYPGIDLTRRQVPTEKVAHYRRLIGWREGQRVIGTVGRLARQKAPLDLVAAAAMLVRERPGLQVLFVGDGPLRPQVERAIARQGLAHRVHILGFCSDVDTLLGMMDVFVLPSIYEGQPISIMEAMRNEVPVVAADVNGVSELVRHGVTGILVPPSQPQALAKAVAGLLDNPERCRHLAVAGRDWLENRYSVQGMVDQIAEIYGRLLGRQGELIACVPQR